MKPAELVALLQAFFREKSAMRQRHAAAAQFVGDYDFNNTYQYVINREDIQLQWLRDAIEDRGSTVDDQPMPALQVPGKGKQAQLQVITEDAAQAASFVNTWRPRIETLTDARNRTMLRVVLGETEEARRFFEQMLAGRSDLLGRRADGAGTEGVVLPDRWVN